MERDCYSHLWCPNDLKRLWDRLNLDLFPAILRIRIETRHPSQKFVDQFKSPAACKIVVYQESGA